MPQISEALAHSIGANENRQSAVLKSSLHDFLKTHSAARVPGGRAKSRVPSFRAAHVTVDSFEQPAEVSPVAWEKHLSTPAEKGRLFGR